MRRFMLLFVVLLTGFLTACTRPVAQKIIYKPINLSNERVKLTREYRCKHYDMCGRDITIQPKMIVLHWTDTANWHEAYSIFNSPKIEGRPYISKYGDLNTSAQFLVARNGTIYQLMPSDMMARHIIGLNYLAIGIENAGGVNGVQNLTQQQVKADVYLVHMLKQQYPSIEYLIGHYEYACFRDTPLWKESFKNYITAKTDPGPRFMQAVRAGVSGLDLKGCP